MMCAHRWLAAGAMAIAIANPAQAAWPERPITLIIPAAPGGTTDISARLIADKLSAKLGQQVIVENRASAAGIPGTHVAYEGAAPRRPRCWLHSTQAPRTLVLDGEGVPRYA